MTRVYEKEKKKKEKKVKEEKKKRPARYSRLLDENASKDVRILCRVHTAAREELENM